MINRAHCHVILFELKVTVLFSTDRFELIRDKIDIFMGR